MQKSEMTSSLKNWFGREGHPSDALIHWMDDRTDNFYWADGHIQTFEEYVDKIRVAYDLINNSDPNVASALKLLLAAQRHVALMDERDESAWSE